MTRSRDDDSIATMCQKVVADIDPVTIVVVDQIRARLPSYASVPVVEHRESIKQQLLHWLEYMAHGHDALDIDLVRELGRQRALQGMSLSDVIESFHIGSRELWRALVETSPGPTPELLDAAGELWDLVHAATTAVATGHSEATRTVAAVRASRRSVLFGHLEQGRISEETRRLAAALNFDPDAGFQVACTPAEDWSEIRLQDLQHALDAGPARALCSRRDDAVVTIFQSVSSEVVVEVIRRVHPDAAVGLGLVRPRLAGATTSMRDARRAMALLRAGGRVCDFRDAWMSAILAEHRGELEPILAVGAEVAASNPHLAEAVVAFTRNGFSASAAARELHLHANSLAYRLERWQQLTGWDLHTVDGLVRSTAAIDLREIPEPMENSLPRIPMISGG
ncbi:PucR family transcriptional regulator [Gordonia sp. NPDC003424]